MTVRSEFDKIEAQLLDMLAKYRLKAEIADNEEVRLYFRGVVMSLADAIDKFHSREVQLAIARADEAGV